MPGAGGIKAGKAYVEVGADSKKLDEGLKEGHSKVKAWVEGVAKTAKGLRLEQRQSGETALERVLGGGAEGVATTLAEFMGAGAAVIGINFLSEALNKAGEEASKLRKEMGEGTVNAADIAIRMASAVPIFGQLFLAGRALREAITGEEAAIESVNEEAKLTVELYNQQAEAAKRVHKILMDLSTQSSRSRADAASMGADSFTRERSAVQQGAAERATSLPDRTRDLQAQINADASKQIALAQAAEVLARDHLKRQTLLYIAHPTESNKQEVLDTAREIPAAAARVKAVREREAKDLQNISASLAEADRAAAVDDAAKLRDIAKREGEEYTKIIREGREAAGDAMIDARAEDLRREGRAADAELLLIEHEAEKKRAAILRNAQEQAKAVGATSILDPRRLGIFATAIAQIAGVNDAAAAKSRTAGAGGVQQELSQAHELAMLRIESVRDAHEREKQQILEKYAFELEEAKANGKSLVDIKARELQELANLEQRYAEQKKQATEDIDYELAQQQIENTTRGLAQRLALIELERQRALKKELDPATAVGIGTDRINELYDARRDGAMLQGGDGGHTFGTFSAAAASAGAVAGGGQLLQAAQKTAAGVEKLPYLLIEIERAIRQYSGTFAG